MSSSGNGLCEDVELDIICVTVKVENMLLYEQVEDEEERTKHLLRSGGRGAVVDTDELG